jgi:5'-3' exonuclease
MPNPPVILIDLSNLVFRMAFAHQGLAYEGKPTGVVYGVLKTIYDLRINVSPRIVACWDHGVPVPGAAKPKNWREGVLKTYKANRRHDDETYQSILRQFHDVFTALNLVGYSSVSVIGLEADDIIGILANEIQDDVLIFSTDKDFFQLLSDRTQILVPQKEQGGFRRISKDEVEKQYGIPIDRFAEYLALGGDSADNIKPKRGMGPKTAIKLIQGGADLRGNKSFAQQSLAFKLRHADLEPFWPAILKSYYAAQIPVFWNDLRIQECVAAGIPKYSTFQSCVVHSAGSRSKEHFAQFLADRGMTSLLALRHKFFETSNERAKTSCVTQHLLPPPLHRPTKRTLI